jgi:uncharacterized protein (TIGR00369 family)
MSIHSSASNRLDAERIERLIDARFPQIHAGGRNFVIEEATAEITRVRMKVDVRSTRPGGTVSGVAMFALADFSVYVAVIGRLGEAGLDAVTTNLNINFLAKPDARDIVASVRLLRMGRRLAVGEAELFSGGSGDPVAHAVATYALPASVAEP